MCRVTTSIVCLPALVVSVRCNVVLAPKLSVEKSLLNIISRALLASVCVTDRCRPRLLEKPALFRVMWDLSFRGSELMNLWVRVILTVRPSCLLEVLWLLHCRPLVTAFENNYVRRRMQDMWCCRLRRATPCMLMLLRAILF